MGYTAGTGGRAPVALSTVGAQADPREPSRRPSIFLAKIEKDAISAILLPKVSSHRHSSWMAFNGLDPTGAPLPAVGSGAEGRFGATTSAARASHHN